MFSLRLAQYLGRERPFYVIQPHGIDGGPIPYTIEEMAASHVRSLRGIQEHGPYLLGGYGCFGSVVAFEMAQQLHAQGERADLLALISTVSPTLLAANKFVYRALSILGGRLGLSVRTQRSIFLLLRDLWDSLASFRKLNPREMALFGPRLLRSFVDVVSAMARRSNAQPGEDSIDIPPRLGVGRRLKNDPYWWAMAAYTPEPYSDPVSLFQAEAERSHRSEPTEGWKDILSDIDLHLTPGTNATSVTEYLPILASQLRASMQRVDPSDESPAA
jgi:hypothetical protein